MNLMLICLNNQSVQTNAARLLTSPPRPRGPRGATCCRPPCRTGPRRPAATTPRGRTGRGRCGSQSHRGGGPLAGAALKVEGKTNYATAVTCTAHNLGSK